MQLILYLLLFVLGIIFFILSTDQSDLDVSNTYQVQYSFLSMIIWVANVFNSFNVVMPSTSQTYDYTFIAISLAMFVLSLLNTIILMFYGTYNMLFKVAPNELKYQNGRVP